MSDVAATPQNHELRRIFDYHRHPVAEAHLTGSAPKPEKVADQHDRSNAAARFNAALAVRITDAVGSMWCAYVFTIIALIGLPMALRPGGEGIIAWIAQTFLQLVLLSVIIVGQNVQAAASDKRAENTYNDAEAILHEATQIQDHLAAQDQVLSRLITQVLGVVRAEDESGRAGEAGPAVAGPAPAPAG
jgi:hypothetical protein